MQKVGNDLKELFNEKLVMSSRESTSLPLWKPFLFPRFGSSSWP